MTPLRDGGSHAPITTPEPFKVWTDSLGVEHYLHGTKADLKPGDLIEAGRDSNYGERKSAAFVYLTATLDAATWGAELAVGEGPGRIYIVEPTGPIEDDPNLTDKKFPGNPTKSYRTRDSLRVTGEITDWKGHAPEQLQAMKDAAQGVGLIVTIVRGPLTWRSFWHASATAQTLSAWPRLSASLR